MVNIRRRLYQLLCTSRLFGRSFRLWGRRDWLRFWFTNRQEEIQLGSLRFLVRTTNAFTKVSDLWMLFGVIQYDQYGDCDIPLGGTVIDIGAHLGSFSLLAADRARRVYAYEPTPSTYELLKKNIELNQKSNVFAFNAAVGAKDGTAVFHVNPLDQGANSLYARKGVAHEVKVLTLQRIFKDNNLTRCDLLKMDCEGAEYDILFSSQKLLDKVSQIVMEYHEAQMGLDLPSEYSAARLQQYLEENGFRVITQKVNNYKGRMYAQRRK